MRYTIGMSDKINTTTTSRRRGVAPGTVHNPLGIGLRKDDEARNAKADGRVPARIRELLDARPGTVADAIIEAVEIAEAYGWQKPAKTAPAGDHSMDCATRRPKI